MARAKVGKDGAGVRLYLSFREAAALFALLCRVGYETDLEISEATCDTWAALQDLKEYVDDPRATQSIWPRDFDAFSKLESSLVEDDEVEED